MPSIRSNLIALSALSLTIVILVGVAHLAGRTQKNDRNLASLVPYDRIRLNVDDSFFAPNDAGRISYEVKPQAVPSGPPRSPVTARAYLAGNVETGKIYFESNASTPLPVASMSKLVTTIAATDMFPGSTTIAITAEEAAAPADGSNLMAGEQFSLNELLYPMLLDSSNVAAEAIAASDDRAKFLDLMSSYAWEIGMPTAYFADPSGINARNVASGHDIFGLARYLYSFRPDILALTRTAHSEVATTSDHAAHSFDSIHPFVHDVRFIGGKTGRTTQAGETMLTVLRIHGQPIAFVVMGSAFGARQADTTVLVNKVQAMLGGN